MPKNIDLYTPGLSSHLNPLQDNVLLHQLNRLKNKLKKLNDFRGVTGLTSFDNNGEVRKKLYLLQIQGKRFVELEHH